MISCGIRRVEQSWWLEWALQRSDVAREIRLFVSVNYICISPELGLVQLKSESGILCEDGSSALEWSVRMLLCWTPLTCAEVLAKGLRPGLRSSTLGTSADLQAWKSLWSWICAIGKPFYTNGPVAGISVSWRRHSKWCGSCFWLESNRCSKYQNTPWKSYVLWPTSI